MRRWLGLLTACGLLALSAAGCCYTAGVCDCAGPDHDPCYGCMGGGSVSIHHAAIIPISPTPMPVSTTPMTKVTD